MRDGDVVTTGHRLPAGTEILRGIPRQSEGEADSYHSFDAGTESRTAVRDPWQEDIHPAGNPGPAGHTHDPHEVTVQLDAVQLGDGFVRRVEEGIGVGQAPADRPVFVDESGRRSRRFRRIGMVVALACGVYAVVIVATLLSGNSNAPWLPVPGQKQDPSAGQVDSPPLPEQSDPATGTGTTAPSSTPTADKVTSPSPGPSAVERAATTEPGRRGTTARPSPTATRTTPDPGTGATDPAPTEPADPPTTPVAEPTPTVEPTPQPTETLGAGGSDTGTVAEGPAETPQPEPTPTV